MSDLITVDAGQPVDDPFTALAEVFAGRRALVLEDDPALADHVADRLLRAGFSAVDRFEAGEAALEAARSQPYDVLILDRLTAGLDGLGTLKRLRATAGLSADAPALIRKLAAEGADIFEARWVGADLESVFMQETGGLDAR